MTGQKRMDHLYMTDNEYGFRLNVNHAAVKPLYEMYHKANGLPLVFPIADAERVRFETMLLALLEAGAYERARAMAQMEREKLEQETQKKDAVRMVGSPLHSVQNENAI